MSNELEAVFPRHRLRTADDDPGLLDWRSRRQQTEYRRFVEANKVPSLRRYNLTISHEAKFVWFRVAKAGTTTILNSLNDHGVHLDAVQPLNVHYPVRDYDSYFKFAFVRNPWDRLVSCWKTKVRKGNFLGLDDHEHERSQDFANFVAYVEGLDLDTCNNHVRRQSALIDLNEINFLGRVENLDDDLNTVFTKLGLPTANIVAHNVSTRANSFVYRTHYDDALAERVAKLYRLDTQVFGYEF